MSARIKKFIFWLFKKKQTLVSEKSNQFSNIKTILFIRNDRIGDIIVSTGFLKKLKEIHPDAKITILFGKYNHHSASLVKGLIDEVIVLPKKFKEFVSTLLKIRKKKFDLIIDPIDNPSTTSSLVIGIGKPKYSLGFSKENKIYTHVINSPDRSKIYIARRIIELMLAFGVDPNSVSERPSIEINQEIRKSLIEKYKVEQGAIGIVLSGSNDSKFWGIDNFEKLLMNLIKKTDKQIIVYQTPQHPIDYWDLVESTQTIFIPSGKNLEEFVAMISMCSVLFTPDTAAVHVASACGIPTLAMYRVTDTKKYGMPWHPVGVDSIVLTDQIAINRIRPETVFEKLMELVNRNQPTY